MKPAAVATLSASLALALLTGCGPGAADDGRPKVVASFYPLQYVAERVAGDKATVTNLTHPGQEPHDIELSVQQTADIVDADLVFYEKGLQAAVDGAVAENGPEHVLDAAAAARLHPTQPGGEVDPHFWLDPVRLGDVARAFEQEIAAVDPDHATVYAENLTALETDLTRLDEEFRAGLAHCTIDTIVVSHDAFGYLGERYGLQVVGISGLSPDAEPSPAHIRRLHDLIETTGITTVFSETLASPEMADSLAGDLGIKPAVLDPIEGLSDQTSKDDYLSLMRKNLTALRSADGCS